MFAGQNVLNEFKRFALTGLGGFVMRLTRLIAVSGLGLSSLAACGSVDLPSRNATLEPLTDIVPAIAMLPDFALEQEFWAGGDAGSFTAPQDEAASGLDVHFP